MISTRSRWCGVVAGLALIVTSACAEAEDAELTVDSTTSSAEGSTSTTLPVTSTAPTTAAPTTTEAPTTTAADPPESNPLGGDDPEDELMPNVMCMNLQQAQDEIQDHGVFYSRSVDATGGDRNQILDSNWVVVGQTPGPGAPIGEGDAVLAVVKYGEESSVGSPC